MLKTLNKIITGPTIKPGDVVMLADGGSATVIKWTPDPYYIPGVHDYPCQDILYVGGVLLDANGTAISEFADYVRPHDVVAVQHA